MATVLFVCLHNAGRSQMSQALFERAAGGRHQRALGRNDAGRAASIPRSSRSWRELGVDLAGRTPQLLTPRAGRAGRRRRDDGLRRCLPRTSPASAISTGTCPTRRGVRSMRCARRAKRSRDASRRSSPSWTGACDGPEPNAARSCDRSARGSANVPEAACSGGPPGARTRRPGAGAAGRARSRAGGDRRVPAPCGLPVRRAHDAAAARRRCERARDPVDRDQPRARGETERWCEAIGGAGAVRVASDSSRRVYAEWGLGRTDLGHFMGRRSLQRGRRPSPGGDPKPPPVRDPLAVGGHLRSRPRPRRSLAQRPCPRRGAARSRRRARLAALRTSAAGPSRASSCRPAGRAARGPGSRWRPAPTWKCAVAVWASRKRRCSGELS